VPRWVALALTLLAALAVNSRAADARPSGSVPRVGFLYFGSARTGLGAERYAAFLEGMRALGYVEGESVLVEARFADAKVERISALIYPEAGGLMSYGAPLIENFRRPAACVDTIFKGAKPAELPFGAR